jgi:hypothetical protein
VDSKAASMICHRQNESLFLKHFSLGSDRPISDLEVEMSEATNMRVVSFAQDII